MNAKRPIKILVKWHQTAPAVFIRKYDPLKWGESKSPLTFITFFVIFGVGILALPRLVALVFGAVMILLFPVIGILYYTAVSKPPYHETTPLSKEEKRVIIDSLKKKAT